MLSWGTFTPQSHFYLHQLSRLVVCLCNLSHSTFLHFVFCCLNSKIGLGLFVTKTKGEVFLWNFKHITSIHYSDNMLLLKTVFSLTSFVYFEPLTIRWNSKKSPTTKKPTRIQGHFARTDGVPSAGSNIGDSRVWRLDEKGQIYNPETRNTSKKSSEPYSSFPPFFILPTQRRQEWQKIRPCRSFSSRHGTQHIPSVLDLVMYRHLVPGVRIGSHQPYGIQHQDHPWLSRFGLWRVFSGRFFWGQTVFVGFFGVGVFVELFWETFFWGFLWLLLVFLNDTSSRTLVENEDLWLILVDSSRDVISVKDEPLQEPANQQ